MKITRLKIAYWALFKPVVFAEFCRLFVAKQRYDEKVRKHGKCFFEGLHYRASIKRFNAVLKG